MRPNPRGVLSILKETAKEWSDDDAPRLGAALAFYTLFSIAPMLIILVSVLGMVLGEEASRGQLFHQIDKLVGRQGAEAIQSMIANASQPGRGTFATVVGFITLFVGATGVFAQLQEALNKVWNVPPRPISAIKNFFKERVLSFAMVLGIGFLLLVSLVLSAAVAAVGDLLADLIHPAVLHVINFVFSFAMTTVLFALIYKYIPDVKVEWHDVWVGAAVTAFLFSVGRFLIGLYLGRSSVSSSYGAAGSLVVVLMWVYYASQILFFGAEFTQVWARRRGSWSGAARGAHRRDEPPPRGMPQPAEA